MNDLFGGDERIAELLSRVEALEAVVYQQAKAERTKVDEPLNEAWQLWNRHRNGKGWTAEAKKLNMRKLRELAGTDGELAVKIVRQAIELGYTGLWPLKTLSDSRSRLPSSEAPSAVQTKTVAQALAPSETKEERDRAYREQQKRLGLM
jgi:hypothetical protein